MPQAPSYSDHEQGLIRLTTSLKESVAAVYYPASPGKPTLIYAHGNAEDLGQSVELYQAWNAMGLGVLAYDYPGYGLSTGKPSEASCFRAAESAWEYLTKKGIPASSIIVVGRSVGSGPSTWVAAEKSPAGLVLISPFTSTFAVKIPWPILPGDRFKNLERIKHMKTPLLVFHGADDRVIPVSHGQKLVECSASTDKHFELIKGAGHNDLFELAGDRILMGVADFALRVAH